MYEATKEMLNQTLAHAEQHALKLIGTDRELDLRHAMGDPGRFFQELRTYGSRLPRQSGKSTWAMDVIGRRSDVALICRDATQVQTLLSRVDALDEGHLIFTWRQIGKLYRNDLDELHRLFDGVSVVIFDDAEYLPSAHALVRKSFTRWLGEHSPAIAFEL
jgi:hypothetical protein